MTQRKKLLILCLLSCLLLSVAGGSYFFQKMLLLDNYKDTIITALQGEIKRTVRYRNGEFSFRPAPAFSFNQVEILEKDGTTPFLTAQHVTFKLALLPLLERKVVLKEMLLDHPTAQIIREKDGRFNYSDLLEQKKEGSPLQITRLHIRKGAASIFDKMISKEGVRTFVNNLEVSAHRLTRGKNCTFKVSAMVGDEIKKGSISVSGTAKLAPEGRSLSESAINGRIAGKDLDAGRYWAYYQKYVPFRKTAGLLNVDSDFKGKLTSFTSRGNVQVSNLRFDYPQVFHAVLTPRDVHFRYDLELTPHDLNVKSLDFSLDGFRVKGSCALRDIHSKDLRITARATTSTFRLQDYHQYIPYGVIVKDTADFIEQHIKGGIYRLDEGTLDGRISQIAHMEKGDNYNVLYIRGRVEEGILSFGKDVPTFNGIKGELEMRGKDFNLNRMSGLFGTSPFTLDGKITDYPLNQPSGYPFSMVMTPRQPEAAWLFDRQKSGKMVLSGPSTLRLTGEGFTSGYNLSGEWDLSQAAYSYPDVISKPAGRSNKATFRGSISKQDARLSSLTLSLHPLQLTANADYRFADKPRFACELRTNQFPSGEIAPLLPKVARYQPAGKIQATINGTSRRDEWKKIRWSGEVSFADASIKPAESIGTLHEMTGTVRFSDEKMETSQMTLKLGSSTISGRGTLNGFRDPAVSVEFVSPSLLLADVGFRAPGHDIKIAQVSGSLSLVDNDLQIRSLSGQVNKSALSVKGEIFDLRHPEAQLAITASHLELDDLMALTELEPIRKRQGGSPDSFVLKTTLAADTVTAHGYNFEKLRTTLSYQDKILYMQPFECRAYGGHITGRGRFDFGTPRMPRHQINYNLERVATERLTQAAGVKRQEISGSLSLAGDLTTKGSTSADLKKNALGSARLRIEEGTIHRFPVLSKVFSILNVSQLIKGKLPDMVSGGMPFNKITATLGVQDGIISTQDLYVDSNAINISAVGKLDMNRNELDMTIGVRPLQTVDKVVSHLPIVGWVLTGKDKALITTYFEAKGKVEDPVVKAIPVKAMTKGVFNIFKRLFQLPAKLFTETGEVIIGK